MLLDIPLTVPVTLNAAEVEYCALDFCEGLHEKNIVSDIVLTSDDVSFKYCANFR